MGGSQVPAATPSHPLCSSLSIRRLRRGSMCPKEMLFTFSPAQGDAVANTPGHKFNSGARED